MAVNPVEEQIKLYARQLKTQTFGNDNDLLRRINPHKKFENILLELMKTERAQRQENQNIRRLKAAGFPYCKTIDELDLSRYDGEITETLLAELATCKFVEDKKNIVMIGNPGRAKRIWRLAWH